jgi:hypothetical protein
VLQALEDLSGVSEDDERTRPLDEQRLELHRLH